MNMENKYLGELKLIQYFDRKNSNPLFLEPPLSQSEDLVPMFKFYTNAVIKYTVEEQKKHPSSKFLIENPEGLSVSRYWQK